MLRRTPDEIEAEFMARPGFDRAAYEAEGRRLERRELLGQAIRVAREAAKMTQAALASELGTTQPAIARLEAGMVDPKLSTLERLVEVLHRDITIGVDGVTIAA